MIFFSLFIFLSLSLLFLSVYDCGPKVLLFPLCQPSPSSSFSSSSPSIFILYVASTELEKDRQRRRLFSWKRVDKEGDCLAYLDKDPSSACDGRAAFQRVRKWTRKVNILEKDYIVIPVNYMHYLLMVYLA
ncbi:unnamed protein product [Vicia faba]|uniref:Uncharacterized protein n=1 Tax=Vicia faba TaxID=3906 RepID=A0AAV0YG18_VICFA|nr:unnamed protein product [Vicia faba]